MNKTEFFKEDMLFKKYKENKKYEDSKYYYYYENNKFYRQIKKELSHDSRQEECFNSTQIIWKVCFIKTIPFLETPCLSKHHAFIISNMPLL